MTDDPTLTVKGRTYRRDDTGQWAQKSGDGWYRYASSHSVAGLLDKIEQCEEAAALLAAEVKESDGVIEELGRQLWEMATRAGERDAEIRNLQALVAHYREAARIWDDP